VFLKALTLKGFKSFADKTVLDFEPGVTVVVGPNGSGKSNLVDAVAWVLGAQGPRTLRGAKMEDVIFAGTPQRAALGRAEVSLTIDNSAGILPIEFNEVTITRRLFRDGDSEYEINESPCRLLDITELLSDTGIGRQQHVIVGQGQLDTVLNARPEDRRAIVEEAAGVLKYRKRREKAERRLEATEGNQLRLNDLLREVRRQLTPLERQADAARRYEGVEAEWRTIRIHLIGRELASLRTRRDRAHERRAEMSDADRALHDRLAELDQSVEEAERSLTSGSDEADALVRSEALRERGRGLRALAIERRRGLERDVQVAADAGVVATLVADADALRRELDGLELQHRELAPERDALNEAERSLAEARSRRHESERSGGVALARDQRRDAETAVHTAEAAARAADRAAARARAHADALEQAYSRARVGGGIERLAAVDGVVGSLIDQLAIEPGAEAAVAAALGESLYAVVVDGGLAARRALETLTRGAGHALLLVLDGPTAAQGELTPPGTRPLAECVRAPRADVADAVTRLLAGTVIVNGDWRSALDVALANPGLVVVTSAGDRLGGTGVWQTAGAGVLTRAALDEAATAAEVAEGEAERSERAATEVRVALAAALAAEETAAGEAEADWAALEIRTQEASTVRRELEVRAASLDARRQVLRHRLAEVEARLAGRDHEAAEAAQLHAAVADRLDACRAIEARLDVWLGAIDEIHGRFAERRRRRTEAAHASATKLDEFRAERRELETQLGDARDRGAKLEIEEAELAVRLDALVERIRTEFDCEPEDAELVEAPEVPEGVTLAARARELERELKVMGPVNPLALTEFEALQERHEFLHGQLEDVRESRRELQRVIRAVDREIQSTFETAFADVQRNFSDLFSTLFPGGSGRIVLTASDDLLNTGIEVEARPSGKNVRRLSLLSGGERSLTALAFLFAVFRSRPSPFYLLDEVEAALDDVNLHRFLDLVHEFRDEAQLVIVSHQKRTMEAADCLYGVSMPPGGSTRVVSQRMEADLVLD